MAERKTGGRSEEKKKNEKKRAKKTRERERERESKREREFSSIAAGLQSPRFFLLQRDYNEAWLGFREPENRGRTNV